MIILKWLIFGSPCKWQNERVREFPCLEKHGFLTKPFLSEFYADSVRDSGYVVFIKCKLLLEVSDFYIGYKLAFSPPVPRVDPL